MSGAFVAVVGPSGAGKDSVLRVAQEALAGRGGFVFPQRWITRPEGPGEDHRPLSKAEFLSAEARDEFALTWRAHGLGYGIPADAVAAVSDGNVVVANVSRETLGALGGVFGRAFVVRVTVSEEVRLERIVARGREDAAAAAARAERADPSPDHPVDLEIVNDGSLAEAAAILIRFLEDVARR